MSEAADICATLTARLAGHSLPVIRQTSAKVIALLSSKNSDVETIAELRPAAARSFKSAMRPSAISPWPPNMWSLRINVTGAVST